MGTIPNNQSTSTNEQIPDADIEMEIFRAGEYGAKGSYSETDLQQIADDYRPDILEAPLTFDHAQTGPAYGWVSRIRRDGDRLVAALKGVPDSVRELVRNGSYKRRSVELFRKLSTTGRPYLRAVSLLGAATPEVKGLRDVCFTDGGSNVAVRLSDETESDWQVSLQHELLESRLATMFAELRADGYRLPENDAAAIRRVVCAVRPENATVSFDDTIAGATLDWLSGFLRQSLLRAPLGEAVPNAAVSRHPADTAIPFSERTDPRSMSLHGLALNIQAESPGLTYRDALLRASKRS